MGLFILLFMIVIPVVEISVFIQASEQIGFWSIVGLVIITAMIGSALLRHQGFTTLSNFHKCINTGKFPIDELFNGLCILLAGAFLITPGFVTDGFGLILFLPNFREIIKKFVRNQLKKRMILTPSADPDFQEQNNKKPNSIIIDGEFHEIKTKDAENSLSPPKS